MYLAFTVLHVDDMHDHNVMHESSHSMEAYSTKAKAEDKRRLLMERRAKLKVLLDNERDQLEVYTCTM